MSLASLGTGLVDFAIALGSMLGMCVAVRRAVRQPVLLLLPVVLLVAVLTAGGVGVFARRARGVYRDVRYVVPFLVQLLDVRVAGDLPGEPRARALAVAVSLNPMVGVIDGFRCGAPRLPTRRGPSRRAASVVSAVLAAIGVAYFRRVERAFADVVLP